MSHEARFLDAVSAVGMSGSTESGKVQRILEVAGSYRALKVAEERFDQVCAEATCDFTDPPHRVKVQKMA